MAKSDAKDGKGRGKGGTSAKLDAPDDLHEAGKTAGKKAAKGDKPSKRKVGATHGDEGGLTPLSKSDYLAALEPMQVELNNLARWLQHTGRRLLVIFEGRDTAGKGGAIAAVSERLNPRMCHTVALSKPSEREATQWYFQRYMPYLPAAGEIVLFDRSWYNRAGVERVMGFCSDEQYRRFLQQAPQFERMLVDDGLLLFKYWLGVDQAQQEARFAERLADPLKRWKLSPIDLKARERYEAYGEARDAMLAATHKPEAPWTLIDFNDQRRGRLTLLRHLLDHVPDTHVPDERLDFPALKGPLHQERYRGPLQPLGPYVAKRASSA